MYSGGMQGQGRATCMSNFDGFRLSNIPLYVSHFALPVPPGGAGSNIVVVPCSGGGAGAGTPGAEGDLDIQQQLGMAPLATIRVYDSPPGGSLFAVLAQETSDNQCDQISESYGWQLSGAQIGTAHNYHLSMSAEGITYMAASGDSGTSLDPFSYPDLEPEVLSVGGTVATVNTTTGARISEVGWSGGGGGWSTNASAVNVRPPWQVGNGVPAINGSNNHRLVPDVAFHSSSGSGAYQFYLNGGLQGGYVGTSFAAPLFSGDLCIIEQQAIALGGLPADIHGHRRFGRIQDYIYSQNGNPTIWFDIITGSNGALPAGQGTSSAHVGWDTVGGWGPMNCQAFAMRQRRERQRRAAHADRHDDAGHDRAHERGRAQQLALRVPARQREHELGCPVRRRRALRGRITEAPVHVERERWHGCGPRPERSADLGAVGGAGRHDPARHVALLSGVLPRPEPGLLHGPGIQRVERHAHRLVIHDKSVG
jgi:hypothetical protein